jgi:DNA-binding HxlR family transcriptional regulator
LYHRAIELIGRRWTGAILRSMLGGNDRFSEIRRTVPGLSDRLLSARLKELAAEALVERHDLGHSHVEYRLTTKGHALAPVVRATEIWAERWLSGSHQPRQGRSD